MYHCTCISRRWVECGMLSTAFPQHGHSLITIQYCPAPDHINHTSSTCAQVVFYYISQSKANNHAVREAACAVIAELMEKVDKAAVSPHVPDLLRALLLCFKDSSWPVRDAACTACGRWVLQVRAGPFLSQSCRRQNSPGQAESSAQW